MRPLLFLLAAVALAATPGAAAAIEYPWCAEFADGAGSNCGFTTYEQCMATARGTGGYCARNPMYSGPAGVERPQDAPRRPRSRRPAKS